ncbi:IclR family transcriptional regulator C-terminal domain-containing protein [Microbacterium lacus]|uniref:IclR-ED domain-containing protein n=1 Tax=Microbacterium lacus TaxID=415217 RepID=A0ABP4S6X8_9MICO
MDGPSSLAQGLTLLGAVVDRERSGRPGHNASRLAEITGMERSRVSRLTQELRAMDFLGRGEGSAFAVGPAFFRTAGALNAPWLRVARRELRLLAARFSMTARITACDGPQALLLRFESGAAAVDPSIRAGMVSPVWSTGAGRALLLDHDRAALTGLLEGVQFVGVGGPAAARSVDEVAALVDRDRGQGIVRAVDEYVAGITEHAVPIRVEGTIIASISAEGPPVTVSVAGQLQRALIAAAARLGSE